ncbi:MULTISPECIES: glycosyltransferase family 2 protein [Acidiphilium]|uniref:Glycosyltransferase involved in cell wall bisynthesis n=1 Tax=Acidiphilium rubrum TaxID=526 RepID=A0A8G2FEX3_ACIRU|nr:MULTISPECIES: glycosyltransferase family 2 protein [Acidiphilium]SIR46198.1 Glycosyltransferase involved in cell wall bisynthesis [Acidiphilium rubrum]
MPGTDPGVPCQRLHVAVLLPCHNEGIAIGRVVRAFRAALPDATVFVFDNNSTDNTIAEARAAGAVVRTETQQGKGHVVRRMFRDIDADYYVMADGDDTYDAGLAPRLLDIAQRGPYDLVNCVRIETAQEAYRGGHRFGNLMLTGAVRFIFGDRVQDMLSGYKILSRRFVKSFPALSTGFDIETELAVHALELSIPIAHEQGSYRGRPPGSESKLRTYQDGWRILKMILKLIRHERPLAFFGAIGLACAVVAMALIIPVLLTYLHTGLVPRLPTAVLATGIMLVGALSLTTGIILDTVTRGRRELRLLAYLSLPAPAAPDEAADQTIDE